MDAVRLTMRRGKKRKVIASQGTAQTPMKPGST
jgi:hypothetical protein